MSAALRLPEATEPPKLAKFCARRTLSILPPDKMIAAPRLTVPVIGRSIWSGCFGEGISMRRFATLHISAAAAVLGMLAGCSAKNAAEPAATDAAQITQAVKADVATLVTAFNSRDAEKAVSFDAPDYVGMFHGQPNVVGPEADLALTKQQIADPASKVEVSGEDVSVAAAGDRALWQATYAYTFTDSATKRATTEHGNWLLGFRKQPDGSWKIKWGVVSDTGPATGATAVPPA